MQGQSHFSRKAVAAWCLVLMVLIQQVISSPVPEMEVNLGSVQAFRKSLKRAPRMTPLWRTMGTKPHGAYCQNHHECSSGICRKGHCSFGHPINS